jgi:hypothetical protein
MLVGLVWALTTSMYWGATETTEDGICSTDPVVGINLSRE